MINNEMKNNVYVRVGLVSLVDFVLVISNFIFLWLNTCINGCGIIWFLIGSGLSKSCCSLIFHFVWLLCQLHLGLVKFIALMGIIVFTLFIFRTITNVVFVRLLMSTFLLVFPLPIFSQQWHSSMSTFLLQPQLIISLKKWSHLLIYPSTY